MITHFIGKRILITGASGYIASNLIHFLKNTNCTIIRLSRKRKLSPVDGIAKIVDITKDVRDRNIFEHVLEDVDIVYHLAGQTSLYFADKNPLDDLEVNVVPMLSLLETCRDRGWKPAIIFSGTVTQAGIPKSLPVNEDHRDRPASIYDMHKLMAENYLIYYARQGIVQGTSLRLSNVYGPGPESSSTDRGVMNMMIRKALENEPLNIYGTGEYLRDYIYIEDVVDAFIKAAININRVNGRYFVIGTGEGKTINQAVKLLVDRVALKTGKRVPVRHIDPPSPLHPVEFRDFVADPQLFIDAAGLKIKYSMTDGIDRTIDSFGHS
jgi:UDP-glucose 4-epimerase